MTHATFPVDVRAELTRIGRGIRTARLRRGMTQEELAVRVGASWHTIRKIEEGAPTTGFGLYLKTLWVLGTFDEVRRLADPALDREGLVMEAARRGQRASTPRTLSRDF
jgi:DNA-binding XRE family transcriptional regulator